MISSVSRVVLVALLIASTSCIEGQNIPSALNPPQQEVRHTVAPPTLIAQTPESIPEITIRSSSSLLTSGFVRAKNKALAAVQTGKGTNIPSYWAGLEDRPAFYLRDFAHQVSGAHLIGLDLENFTMLKVFAESATARRKWYPLWAFDFNGKPFAMDYKSDTHFTRELPAPFELVEKAFHLYKWTGDKKYFTDPALWTYHTNTVTKFIDAHSDKGNPVAKESGTGVGHIGVASYNETGEHLTYSGDAIASQFQALVAYSLMLGERGDFASASKMRTGADRLRDLVETQWWADSRYQYLRGFTQEGPLSGWGREANWFLPMKFITAPDHRNDSFLRWIDKSIDMHNIEAYTYLPEVFFPYGMDDLGWKWLQRLLRSNSDYPEVSYTIVSHTIEGLMGVEVDAGRDAVATQSHLPQDIEWLEADYIPLGQHRLAIMHEGTFRTSLIRLDDRPGLENSELYWTARFPGIHKQLKVDGQWQDTQISKRNGRDVSWVNLEVPNNRVITVEVPQPTESKK